MGQAHRKITVTLKGKLLDAVEAEQAHREECDEHLTEQTTQEIARELIVLGLRYLKEHR